MWQRGVTLLELLVVLALLTIGLLVVAPGLQALATTTAARSEASRLLRSLQLARSHAVLTGVPVTLCASDSATRCRGEFSDGWLVRREAREADAIPARLLRREAAPGGGVSIRRRDGRRPVTSTLVYRPDGTTGRGLTFRVCLPVALAAKGWQVIISATGRPRLARDTAPCPA